MFTNGWIKIHRDISNHWVFQRDDYFKAWIFLLIKANHQDNKTLYSDVIPEVVEIKRGEVVSSLKRLSQELKWNPSKVRRFLKKLEKDNMIRYKDEKKWTHLSICNYETYQHSRHTDETPVNHGRITDENNIRMYKKDKNEKKSISKDKQLKLIKENLQELKDAFPKIDVTLEFDKMTDWLSANGKVYKNYKAFFKNWLRRADERRNTFEDTISYYYECMKCGSKKGKGSKYKDLYMTCCDMQMQCMKE